MGSVVGAYYEEQEAYEEEGEVDEFCLDVFFTEDYYSEQEWYDDAAAAYHRHY